MLGEKVCVVRRCNVLQLTSNCAPLPPSAFSSCLRDLAAPCSASCRMVKDTVQVTADEALSVNKPL